MTNPECLARVETAGMPELREITDWRSYGEIVGSAWQTSRDAQEAQDVRLAAFARYLRFAPLAAVGTEQPGRPSLSDLYMA